MINLDTFDMSKSKVTREGIGLLLYSIYSPLKNGNKVSLTKVVEIHGMPAQTIITALKDCKIIENVSGKTGPSQWKWIPASSPNDLMIEKVLNSYTQKVIEYRKARQEKTDKKNGVNREESGAPVKVPAAVNGTPSLYVRERLEVVEEKQKYAIELLETLCSNLGLKETIGGRKIGN